MTNEIPVHIVMKPQNHEIGLPTYESAGASGMDVRADILEELVIPAGEQRMIPTGVYLELPSGYEVQVRPKSGLAAKHGLSIVNTPGTVDEDYRGEIKVILINHGQSPATITPTQKIAQIVLAPVTRAKLIPVEVLSETARGENGFGSTGTH